MRRFISKWYLSKDPYDLALEVSRVGGRHGWEHRDLVQLARVRSKDSAVAAVLTCVVRGLKKAQEEWGGKPEAQPILEYLACVQQVKNCTGDPGAAERLMEKHSFDIDSLPTELLSQSSIWENGLPRLPVIRVLSHLKSLARKGFLSNEANPVLSQVLQCIKDPLALAASGLQPAEIVGVMAQAGSSWAPPPNANTKTSSPENIPAPHSSLIRGLEMMLVASFNNVPKMDITRLLICVDTRPGLSRHGCWGMSSLSSVRAAAVTILSLKAGKADITLTTMSDTKRVTPLPLVDGDTLDTLVIKLSSPPCAPGYVDPCSLVTWVGANTRYSAVLVITDSHTTVEAKEKLWQEVGGVADKFVYLVLASKDVVLANPEDPSMLDICGWHPQLVRVVQAFVKDLF